MGSYTSDYPDLAFSAEYMRFFQDFYRISDTPDAHDQYAQSFTKDATLVMASKRATGFSGMSCLCCEEALPVNVNPLPLSYL